MAVSGDTTLLKASIRVLPHLDNLAEIFTQQGLARHSGDDAEKYKNDLDTRLDADSIAKVKFLSKAQECENRLQTRMIVELSLSGGAGPHCLDLGVGS